MPATRAGNLLEYLVNMRYLVRISDAVILHVSHYRMAQDYVVATLQQGGILNSPDFRDHLKTTRKYAMALLDFMDRQQITVRTGNERRLLPGYEQRLWV